MLILSKVINRKSYFFSNEQEMIGFIPIFNLHAMCDYFLWKNKMAETKLTEKRFFFSFVKN
jgi:hypothetical protein